MDSALTPGNAAAVMPLLSINIPTYNRAAYLQALIDSFAEDYRALAGVVEVNILDNASPDGTREVIENLPADLQVNYVRHEENLGGLANIHLAHRAGSGRYVWILGDDDYLLMGQLAAIVKLLKQDPCIVLLSYARATPDKRIVGNVSADLPKVLFTKYHPQFRLGEVDRLIGFLSANIIERKWIEQFPADAYHALDERGELAHASIFYAAIAAGEKILYVGGEPLVQTIDNGYLRHDVWIHVCVKYCMALPAQLSDFGFDRVTATRFFNARLFRECVRRVLAEKYRRHSPAPVMYDPVVKDGLGVKIWVIRLLGLIPTFLIRAVYNTLRTRRT